MISRSEGGPPCAAGERGGYVAARLRAGVRGEVRPELLFGVRRAQQLQRHGVERCFKSSAAAAGRAARGAAVCEEARSLRALRLAQQSPVDGGECGPEECEEGAQAHVALVCLGAEWVGRQLECGERGEAREEAELLQTAQRVGAQRELGEAKRQVVRRGLERRDRVVVETQCLQLPAAREHRQCSKAVVRAVEPAQPRAAAEHLWPELGQLVMREVERLEQRRALERWQRAQHVVAQHERAQSAQAAELRDAQLADSHAREVEPLLVRLRHRDVLCGGCHTGGLARRPPALLAA
mmetsp:Transcript_1677/g.4423  ORF Transcript_1677/g.4423 Transcript_1677/m.4423 type:complete len:295 (-) Transcript_1677:7-891(-)